MRKLIAVFCLIGMSLFAWQAFSQRSTAIELKQDYHLTYTVAWGLGMEQRLALKHGVKPWAAASSGWIEIWKRPYNSGAAVYATEDAHTYYIGTSYNMVVATLADGAMYTTCDEEIIPKLTALAEQLIFRGTKGAPFARDFRWEEQIDPGAPQLMTYVPQDAIGEAVPNHPPLSKYYLGLRYLGKFGIVDPGRGHRASRGSEVRFVPAGYSPEPRLGLHFHCG